MNRRQRNRISHHLACDVVTISGRARGIIRDVSDLGLFVETSATPIVNSIVKLLVSEIRDRPAFSFDAGVARMRVRDTQLVSTIPSGIGLEVLPPRSHFERWVVRPARPVSPATSLTLAPLGSQPHRGPGKYRIRLIRQDRPGTQIVTLRSESEDAARAKALRRLGGFWRIAESQPL